MRSASRWMPPFRHANISIRLGTTRLCWECTARFRSHLVCSTSLTMPVTGAFKSRLPDRICVDSPCNMGVDLAACAWTLRHAHRVYCMGVESTAWAWSQLHVRESTSWVWSLLATWVWTLLHGCGPCYMGVDLPAWAWSLLHGLRVYCLGVESTALAWSLLHGVESISPLSRFLPRSLYRIDKTGSTSSHCFRSSRLTNFSEILQRGHLTGVRWDVEACWCRPRLTKRTATSGYTR
jgi:hypothetical protein